MVLVKDEAKRAASRVLEKYWTDDAFPVDPFAIAEKMGINTWVASLGDKSGLLVKEGDSIDLFVDDGEMIERQVFTCAHELGHVAERDAAEDPEYSFTESRSREYDLHEFYADEFAGNLLMPAGKFIEMYRRNGSVSALADFFGVSRSAVQKRLERLRKDKAL